MIQSTLKKICDSNVAIIRNKLGEKEEITKECLKEYESYLNKRYSQLLTEFFEEENKKSMVGIITSIINIETKQWSDLNKEQILSILDKDSSFEYLKFLSDCWFSKVKKCYTTGIFIEDDNYESEYNDLIECLDNIKLQNKETAE